MNQMAALLLLVNLILAAVLTGLILTIQWVHYPLFGAVGEDAFREYHRLHNLWITQLVGPLMVAEAGAAAALVLCRGDLVPAWAAWAAALLLLAVWIATAVASIPAHAQLAAGLDPAVLSRLVDTNWVRTGAWTARTFLLGWLVWRTLCQGLAGGDGG